MTAMENHLLSGGCTVKKYILIISCIVILTSLQAQDGIIDSSFNSVGKVTTAIGGSQDYGASVLVQPDGKIVVAGQTYVIDKFYFSAVRYNTNGTLDTSFDADGKVLASIETYSCTAVAAVIQADGKIILGGSAQNTDGSRSYFAIIRFKSNGVVDSTFGINGRVTTFFRTSSGYDECRSIVLQSDGKIVAAGYSDTTISSVHYYHVAVVRYNTDGSLDNTFSGDGKLTTSIGGNEDYGMSAAIQSDGKIVVAGTVKLTNKDFAVVRYNTDGTLDNTFGTAGIVTTAVGSGDDNGKSVAIQSDGKIVVAGSAAMTSTDFAVVRYDASGVLDPTFNLDGKATTDIIFNGYDAGQSVAIQSDGKIVVAGIVMKSNIYFTYDFALVRFTTSGFLDATFGTSGKVITAFGNETVSAQAVCAAIQSNGAIIAAGYAGGNVDIAVARYRQSVPLPVELVSFTASPAKNGITLNWKTATEVNNYGFEIQRSALSPQQSDNMWSKIGFVEGNGTTNAPKSYTFVDNSASGKTSYRLKQIDRDGKFEYSQTVEVIVASVPKEFSLEQNYPNPFNPTTAISFQLSAVGFTTLKIYDAIGREVSTLISEVKEAGAYSVQFDGARLSSGIYFAKLTSSGKTQMRKLLLLK
jgi:uncharacterized delta-60 repeat protein